MTGPNLIGIDWGTSSVRVYDLEPEVPIERIVSDQGIKRVEDPSAFEPLFEGMLDRLGIGDASVVMSGMITSQQGWIETPYVSTPASADDVAGATVRHEVGGRSVWAMPGVSHASASGTDLMRGEETQIVGVLATRGVDEATIVLPGTHSKWVVVEQGAMTSFATFVTGELFELVRDHSIIGAVIDGRSADESAFARGVEDGLDRDRDSGGLLHSLFSVRTSGVLEPASRPGLHSYLSGLLIGTEIGGATAKSAPSNVTLVGDNDQVSRYRTAFEIAGITTNSVEHAAPRGLKRLAELKGLK